MGRILMSEKNEYFLPNHKRSKVKVVTIGIILSSLFIFSPLYSKAGKPEKADLALLTEYWVHGGFKDFSQGSFDNGGANLYVNAKGTIEMINHYDVNNDGYVDLVLANDHDKIERGPTWGYIVDEGPGENWKRYEMSADSGWMSRVADVDADGYQDLITVNCYNGVTSELPAFIYWGGPDGPEESRTDLPTIGAYDVAVLDINRDGRLDLIFPSAWRDNHNPALPRLVHVYLQGADRHFKDEGERYGMIATGALSIAVADLNKDTFPEIVTASYRAGQRNLPLNTESKVFWGTADGVDGDSPLILPTHGARQVMLKDLNSDGNTDVIFSGSGEVKIFWNGDEGIDTSSAMIIEAKGESGEFSANVVRIEIADVDDDDQLELMIATSEGVQIRDGKDLENIEMKLPVKHARWVTAADLNGDNRLELIVSKNYEENEFKTKSAIFWNGPKGFLFEEASWVPTYGVVGNTAGDLDGDGRPEVIFNNVYDGHVHSVPSYIYLGNEKADYGVENRLEFHNKNSGISLIADLDLDGFPEVVFSTPDGVRIYEGSREGPRLDQFVDLSTHGHHADMEVADFNRDGYLDLLAVASGVSGEYKPSPLFYGSANGFYESGMDALKCAGIRSVIGDVNKDGYLDVLFHDKGDFILIYTGDSEGYSEDRTIKVPCHGLLDAATPNLADINEDGWLDLIVGILGHRLRYKDTLRIFFGGPNGYQTDNVQELLAGYSGGFTGVADYNNDGDLDLLATSYATPTSRTPPVQLFYGNGKTLDFDNPVDLPGYAAGAVTQVDLNRDGWIDIVLGCHRNDIGHQVDSLIYWNSPQGFSPNRVNGIPGLGPHAMTTFDRGNSYTREPVEHYISPPYEIGEKQPRSIQWVSEESALLKLKFQLRSAVSEEGLASAAWMGPEGEDSYFESSGEEIHGSLEPSRWLQYKATFVSPYACGSPKLKEVRIEL